MTDPPASAACETRTGPRVLVVEDHDVSRWLVVSVLAPEGYEVLEAETGTDGLRLARERRPDLILMDINLPDMTGLEAAHLLRADPLTASLPIVALTAHDVDYELKRSIAEICLGYLCKPISIYTLPDSVRDFIRAGCEPT